MDVNSQRFMRDVKLNDPVTVTLPAWAWLGYLAAYQTVEWADMYASLVAKEARDALFDPVFVKEREAEDQRDEERKRSLLARIIPGILPDDDVPPDASGLYG